MIGGYVKKLSVFVIAILISFIGIVNIKALDVQELKKGDKVCVEVIKASRETAQVDFRIIKK